ncbi:MAG: zinc ribbon domain-containing protein [Acidobacteria bacterium]|nr:zinc ribbon domain-containing protein [Acidobacteriota bacterium]
MYCPKCGSHNQDELKFCTRCGINLGVVADALTGNAADEMETDERLVALLTDYYRGRRNMLLGFLLTAIGGLKLSLLSLFKVPDTLGFVILIAAFAAILIFGLAWFLLGATKWNNSSSELKALGYDNPRKASPKRKKPIAALAEGSTVMNVKKYTTDSLPHEALLAPPSVTESTTRFFAEDHQAAPSEVAK